MQTHSFIGYKISRLGAIEKQIDVLVCTYVRHISIGAQQKVREGLWHLAREVSAIANVEITLGNQFCNSLAQHQQRNQLAPQFTYLHQLHIFISRICLTFRKSHLHAPPRRQANNSDKFYSAGCQDIKRIWKWKESKLHLQNKRMPTVSANPLQTTAVRGSSAKKPEKQFSQYLSDFYFKLDYTNQLNAMTKQLILFVLLSLTVFQTQANSDLDQEFNDFKAKHGKVYNEHESRYRIQLYLKNKEKIQQHNADSTQTWGMGHTQFADLSHEEFIYTHLTLMVPSIRIQQQQSHEDLTVPAKKNLNSHDNVPLVSAAPVNWTAAGKITPIKNQGTCGSCYAFSAVDAMESASLIQKSQSQSLSVQQIVDCSSTEGNDGCNGGWPSYSFVYVINSNITTEAKYPYSGSQGKCQANGGNFRISSYKSPFGCSSLLAELAKRPLTVQLDASNWQLYKKGVFNSCSTTVSINHAVLLGGVDGKGNWWIKNSWGKKWGQNGYMLLAAGNKCGICNTPGYSPYI